MLRALLHDPVRGAWLDFGPPLDVRRVPDPDSLPDVLRTAADAVDTRGMWAVCMLSYEAAAAFDPALLTHPPDGFPLAVVSLHRSPRVLASLPPPEEDRVAGPDAPPERPGPGSQWLPSITRAAHAEAVHRIRDLIARGDTYQVNFSFRLRTEFARDPYALFRRLASPSPPPFAAYLDLGSHVLCSLSPELFFRLENTRLVSRPMKGTSPRGLGADDDLLAADRLRRSPKNRAENIMIVDMVRNDVGRVAEPGTVRVSHMYDVEQYPTLWQMTSTVEALTGVSVPEVLAALFPPASITGAPRARTMQIIRDLEESPRHVYTGAIGWMAPGRTSQFSVAIRTLSVDRERAEAEYGVGGGIVWDSDPDEEYRECLTKSEVLERRPPAFSLLETMLWTPDGGLRFLNDHLARLRSSARYFAFPFDEEAIRRALAEALGAPPDSGGTTRRLRVRLLLSREGAVTIDAGPLHPIGNGETPQVRLAVEPVETADPFLYHKTTHRAVYERVLSLAGAWDDVILWNHRGEVTESCIANVVVESAGRLSTPPVACGLLPGTARGRMLRDGTLRERVILVEELLRADRVFLVNAVRGMYAVDVRRGT
jgi:para-aminobenzoate synthetase/4-amino-4-deoxychorismate lyase